MTLEEKAREYAKENTPIGCTYNAVITAYVAGWFEALRSQWRKVEDELPDVYEHVLIETINSVETAIWNPYTQWWDSPDEYGILYDKDIVLRWCPIPKLPEFEENQ